MGGVSCGPAWLEATTTLLVIRAGAEFAAEGAPPGWEATEVTGAPVLKAQHPEFEMWNQGIHARSGVACADCHMPYERVGAQKVSDHHVRSPLLNVQKACQTCHRWPEAELVARVEAIQQRTYSLRDQAMNALVSLIGDLEAAVAAGRTDAELELARTLQRQAQFRLDFVEAENSVGFHAPGEAARILGESINLSREGQLALRDPKYQPEFTNQKSLEGVPEPGR